MDTQIMSCMKLITLLEDNTVGLGMFGILDTMICLTARRNLDTSPQESQFQTQMKMMRSLVFSLLTQVIGCVSILIYQASHVLEQRQLNGQDCNRWHTHMISSIETSSSCTDQSKNSCHLRTCIISQDININLLAVNHSTQEYMLNLLSHRKQLGLVLVEMQTMTLLESIMISTCHTQGNLVLVVQEI